MTELHVPAGSIVGMGFSLAVSWGLPLLLLTLIRRKQKADILPFFLGCGSFFLFAMLLEQLMHSLVLLKMGPVSQALRENLWFYALYGGLAAGLFEETGRYLTMRFLMKGKWTRENALMYGAGHGGMEAVLILGMASVNNLIYSVMINSGSLVSSLSENMDSQQVLESLAPLGELPSWQFFLGGGERVLAIALHLALSLFVWQAVKNRDKWFYYPLAIVLHMAVNMAAVLAANLGKLVLAEAVTLAGTLVIGYAAWKWCWSSENRETKEQYR